MPSEMKFTTKYHSGGIIAVDPWVAMSLREGQLLRVTLEILEEPQDDTCTPSAAHHETIEFIDFLKSNVVHGGYREAVVTRDYIHEND
ncbi:hypothetical protein [Desulfobulbus alkaliphilus]|uniref:hypothetical protein n=1 Tax=Desulfobulbus alkaliphilus TaxID=869814 RepID=UPI0019630E4D|nr:hypothetical protein [Desulfobulbus alkaliphilus]MBM9538358.1 hypothetical protein [Desulfobulbus alkaliphilus]